MGNPQTKLTEEMMRRTSVLLLLAISMAIVCLPFRFLSAQKNAATTRWAIHTFVSDEGDNENSEMPIQEQGTITKSFPLDSASPHKALEVDNVTGSIEVEGTVSNQVQLVVSKTIRAKSKEKLEEARKDVTLDITEKADSVRLYVNGPFRCRCDECCGFRQVEGYSVQMDFQLRVPREIELALKTVNAGQIRVQDVTGNFSIHNVNGGIEMLNIAGSGTARTVNGGVRVVFRENPRKDSDFGSVNGSIELDFLPRLSADFRFKTFNGGVYSDFPVTALPMRAVQEEHKGRKVVFRADRYTGGRIGSGGPEIKVENLNGDIRILENHV
jgi:hypothetical protein